jgi:hypothetical protein
VADDSLVLLHSASPVGSAASPDISASSVRLARNSPVVRYVLVNDANLKTNVCCAQCGTKIGQHYVRDTGSRSVFCDYVCYICAADKATSGGIGEYKFVCGEPT